MVEGEDGGIVIANAPPPSPSVAFGATSPWRGRKIEAEAADDSAKPKIPQPSDGTRSVRCRFVMAGALADRIPVSGGIEDVPAAIEHAQHRRAAAMTGCTKIETVVPDPTAIGPVTENPT